MWVREIPSAEKLQAIYQADYFHGAEYTDYLADAAIHLKTMKQHLRLLRQHVPAGSRVLDIGCAYGLFLKMIAPEYPDPVGIDPCEDAIGFVRERGFQGFVGSIETVDLKGEFAAICLWDTIEHLPDPIRTIKKALEHLAPGGTLFLTTGDFGSTWARMQGMNWRQIHPPTHLYYFTRKSLTALCHQLGLESPQFGTVTVHRRLGSALDNLARLKAGTWKGSLARWSQKLLPRFLQDWGFPLNLGDTLKMAARKKTVNRRTCKKE